MGIGKHTKTSLSIGFTEALNAAFGVTLPVDIDLSTTYNDRYTVLKAYNNASGNNLDRIRTVGGTTHFAAKVAYQDYVTVAGSWNGNIGPVNSFTVSALTAPIDGLKVSVGYVYGGENRAAAWKAYDIKEIKNPAYVEGKEDVKEFIDETLPDVNELNAAVDVNLGTMLGLGFDLGVSVADRYQFKADFAEKAYDFNTIAATVYGGVDMVSGYVEYAYHKAEKSAQYLEAGVGVALDVVDINAWFGSDDLVDFAKTYYVGASVGSTFGGGDYSLAVEYGAENVTDAYNEFGKPGITITPSVSVSF